MIHVRDLQKTYRIPEKDPGLMGSVRALFKRQYVDRHALAPIS
ncbi:MAG: sugar ABC transporter ATP-binding protein, partial [Proteobacteria bacterium]